MVKSGEFDTKYLLILFSLLLVAFTFYKISKIEKSLEKTLEMLEKIDLRPIKNTIKEHNKNQTEALLKTFEIEMNLEDYKKEQEKKYRDVVRRVLELDNKLNEKYDLLGKAILKINKDIEKFKHK